jgi:hypothetical protein
MEAGTRKHCEQKARTDWSPIGKTRPVPVGSLKRWTKIQERYLIKYRAFHTHKLGQFWNPSRG